MKKIEEAAKYIENRIKDIPESGIILGSGLGPLAEELANPVIIDYGEIPYFPVSTAPGHKGRFVFGFLDSKPVLAMQGRFHFYEGYDMQQVVFPVRVMKHIGIKTLIVTNAAGGINREFEPGDLMMIIDHIKFGGDHPLRGPNLSEMGPRFNDMSQAYDKPLRSIVREAAKINGIKLQEGVYAYMTGPSFETPAEIQMLRILGADAVGMSTVPEVISASHCGLKVIGISCISNMAAGILDQPITEDEVIETGKRAAARFRSLISTIVSKL
jgi:purine-nucleoside phosphorylase